MRQQNTSRQTQGIDVKNHRSAFIRSALQLALRRYAVAKLEQPHAEGYAKHPVSAGGFDVWESERRWGEP
jgi:hypothetical protein